MAFKLTHESCQAIESSHHVTLRDLKGLACDRCLLFGLRLLRFLTWGAVADGWGMCVRSSWVGVQPSLRRRTQPWQMWWRAPLVTGSLRKANRATVAPPSMISSVISGRGLSELVCLIEVVSPSKDDDQPRGRSVCC
eukprot:5932361-Pyramimonas_sp.AAC.1